MNSKVLTTLLYSWGKSGKCTDAQIDVFIKYCLRKNILYKLPHVLKKLEHMLEVKKYETTVQLTSAHRIQPETQKIITKELGIDDAIPIHSKIDSKIVGGFVAEYDYVRYDGSIARQLVELEKNLAQD